MTSKIDGFSTAQQMLTALARAEVSAAELLALHEARIARYNTALNVIVAREAQGTRASAQAADEARRRGDSGALLGLPITLKESMNVRGYPTTVGVTMWKDFCSEHDGAIAQATRAAGAVLLGKTNVASMLFDWQANNPIYGRTNNPWDPTRTPGGSTGGSAAVAAGLTPLEYGSDIGGSIRVPAAFCGVYGHKPSESAVPRSGQFPFPPLPNPVTMMGVQGPLARCAEDLALALDVVAGPEAGEELAWQLRLPRARHARLADYRVAVLPEVPWVPVARELLDAQERLVSRLAAVGCKVARVQPEALGDHRDSFALFHTVLTVATSATIPAEMRSRWLELVRKRSDVEGKAQARALEGWPGDYILWSGARQRLRRAWAAFFRDWDVLLSPAFHSLAFEHFDHPWPPNAGEEKMFELEGQRIPYNQGLFHPALATLPGLPATAFPVEISRTGLPIALQAIGPYLEDHTAIAFTGLVAQEWGGFRPPPGFS